MGIEVLPQSLLDGKFLRCQPIENGPISVAPIITFEPGLTPIEKVVICIARRQGSRCELRNDLCLYWKGDSIGGYQIVGPGMYKKLDSSW